jgi:hypothetical protein
MVMGLLTPKNEEDLARKVVGLVNNHDTIFKSKPDLMEFDSIIKGLLKEKREKWIKEQFNTLTIQELIVLVGMLKEGGETYGLQTQTVKKTNR